VERESKVGLICQYPLIPDNPDGVKDNTLGLAKILRQKGLETVLIGPQLGKGIPNEAEETLGQSLVPLKLGKTAYKVAITFNLPRAKNILERQSFAVLDYQEPWASPPTFITTLAARRLIEEKYRPAVTVQVHANTEKLTTFQNVLELIGGKSGFARSIMKNNVDERSGVSPDSNKLWAGLIGEDVSLYEVIPNGIDVDRFANEKGEFRDWKELKEQGKKIILATGRHDKRKGFDILVKAVGKLIKEGERRDLLLKMTGRGPETENLKRLVESLGLSEYVEFLGILPEEDLIKAEKNCDLKVAPSIGEEGTNRSILNGRAAGKPVAATRIGGQTFAYGDPVVFGEMAEPSDVESLAENISSMLDLPQEEVDRRVEKGLVYVREVFSWDSVGDKKVKQYERAIEKRRNSLPKSEVVYRR
jgi:glycosyltransferase involved in cell wall biosynthesis